jgi:hypothetical protein
MGRDKGLVVGLGAFEATHRGGISSEVFARPHFFRICQELSRVQLLFRPFSNNRSIHNPSCSSSSCFSQNIRPALSFPTPYLVLVAFPVGRGPIIWSDLADGGGLAVFLLAAAGEEED